MKRRELIKTLAGSAAWTRLGAQTPPAPDGEVKRVLVMFKCHLDVGFTDTQAGVMRKYFDVYYPAAIERAAAMRRAGGDRYVWTTGSWMLYEYLEQAKGVERKSMERAIAGGDIAWHALPFSWQSEVLDRSLMSGAVGFSKSLDKRFGRKTSGAKMTDVPGHTLGLVAPLAENGVKFLHIGVNSASTPWRSGTGTRSSARHSGRVAPAGSSRRAVLARSSSAKSPARSALATSWRSEERSAISRSRPRTIASALSAQMSGQMDG